MPTDVAVKSRPGRRSFFFRETAVPTTFAVIESPYASHDTDPKVAAVELARNEAYLNACMADSFARGEVPFASHGLYTRPGVLDDKKDAERFRGVRAGIAISDALMRDAGNAGSPYVFKRIFYTDRGWSDGMAQALEDATAKNQVRERRSFSPTPGGKWSRERDRYYTITSEGLLHFFGVSVGISEDP
jgi:hypothetical protein